MGSVDRTDDPEPATTPVRDAERGDRAAARARDLPETVGDDDDDGAAAALRSARYVGGTEIARGGMGRVLVATDTVLGRSVALKSLLAAADPDSVRRFQRETRITALLEHPSIVPVYDAGRLENGAPFIAMRKVSGQPLEKLVRSAGSLAERLALVSHIVDAANAVAHAHARGVLHRDLKPANILVGEHGETVVIDWGLAKIVDEDDDVESQGPNRIAPDGALRTHAGAVFGTPGFMSPEQLAGERADRRSDVFALGATLYHVLAQHPPHHDRSPEVMMSRGASGSPPPIAKLVAGVPRDLASIVDKALAFRPEERYVDATSLAADLRRFLTGQLVAARQYTLRERAVRFVRRNRLLVATLSLALVGAVYAIVRVAQERERTAGALDDARERQAQTEEALEQATLMHARALLGTNPTGAIAVVKRLARSPRHWREVRDIGAAAHATGACIGLAGPVDGRTVQVAVSGSHAAVSDFDGRVWVYDLDGRTARELPPVLPTPAGQRRPEVHLVYAGERLIAWDATRIVSIDATGPHDLSVPLVGNIVHVAGTDALLFVTTDDGHLTRIDPGTLSMTAIAVPGATSAVPSPDGRRLAVATVDGLWLGLIEITEPSQRVGRGQTTYLSWDGDSRMLAAVQTGDAILVEDGAAPRVVALHPDAIADVAISRGRLFIRTMDGFLRMGRDGEAAPLRLLGDPGVDIGFLRDGSIVGGTHDGAVHVALPINAAITLRAPTDRLTRIAAAPNGPYVVAVSPGRLYVWNVEDLMPHAQPIDRAQIFVSLAGDRALLGEVGGVWRWRDLATGTEVPVPAAPQSKLMRAVADPAGSTAVFTTLDEERMFVSRYGASRLYELAGEIEYVLARDGVAIGDRAGRVVDFDLRGAPVPRIEHPSPVRGISERAGWQAVLWADGAVWRRRVGDTGPGERGRLPALAYVSDVHVTATGRVCGVGGRTVACWGDGEPVQLELPLAAAGATSLDDARLLVVLADGSLVRADVASRQIDTLLTGGVRHFAMSEQQGLGVANLNERQLVVLDFVENIWWPIANGNIVMPQIATGAPVVRGLLDSTALVTWNLELPTDGEATARWLDRLTNATWTDKRLVWK